MKKIYESPLNGCYESAERIHVYAIDTDDELWEIEQMSHADKCEYFDVFDETGCHVLPGNVYHTYEFNVTANHIVVTETVALNV